MPDWPEALLLTGAYGAGNSAVAEEIADILEARGASYAAIDLDWLTWSNAPGADHGELELLVRNLGAVVANYRAAGVCHFVLDYSVADMALSGLAQFRSTRAALGPDQLLDHCLDPIEPGEQIGVLLVRILGFGGRMLEGRPIAD